MPSTSSPAPQSTALRAAEPVALTPGTLNGTSLVTKKPRGRPRKYPVGEMPKPGPAERFRQGAERMIPAKTGPIPKWHTIPEVVECLHREADRYLSRALVGELSPEKLMDASRMAQGCIDAIGVWHRLGHRVVPLVNHGSD